MYPSTPTHCWENQPYLANHHIKDSVGRLHPPPLYIVCIPSIHSTINVSYSHLQCLGCLPKWTRTPSRYTTLRITEKGILATPLQTSAGRGLAVRSHRTCLLRRFGAVTIVFSHALQATWACRPTLSVSLRKPQGVEALTTSIHMPTSTRYAV